jgi:hypothetical protein
MTPKKSKKSSEKKVIGRKDMLDLPDLQLFDIPCKIDTGAYTSAIHCHRIRVVQLPGGIEELSFLLLDPSHEAYNHKEFRTKYFKEKAVKSSFGEVQYRYVISTKVCIFGKTKELEFTLADREDMRYPILLGRKFLRDMQLVVDVARTNLSYKKKIKKNKA